MLFGTITLTLANILILTLSNGQPGDSNSWIAAPLVMIGLYEAIYSAVLWAGIANVVEDNVMGSAYGIAQSLSNLLAASLPIINGVVHDHTKSEQNGYFWPECILTGIGVVSIVMTVVIWYYDRFTGERLQKRLEEGLVEEELILSPVSEGSIRYIHPANRQFARFRGKQTIQSPLSVGAKREEAEHYEPKYSKFREASDNKGELE